MKTIFLAMTFLFISCSKEESTTPEATPALSGKVSYTINGQTYTSNTFSATLLNGKFGGASDEGTQGRGFDVKIGDSENMEITPNVSKNIFAAFYPNGVYYARNRSESGVKLTIISWDGTTLKASFSGMVNKDGDTANPKVNVSGSFETNSIFKF